MKKLFSLLALSLFLVGCYSNSYISVIAYHPPKGAESATLKIEEWGDFQCPACGQSYIALQPVFDQYADKIQVQFRHFPLTSIHPLAFNAAVASECAADQGKFWEFHDKLFESQPALKKSDLFDYADGLSLDKTKFDDCYGSATKREVVKNDIKEGGQKNINSTPTYYVNGELVNNWTIIPQLLASQFGQATSSNEGSG